MDYRDTKFTITLSNRSDRLYAVTMTNGAITMLENDDELDGNILDLLQGAMGYYEEHGATGEELYQLMISNVRLHFNIEDMIPHDDTLKSMAENFGFSIIYPNGIH